MKALEGKMKNTKNGKEGWQTPNLVRTKLVPPENE